MLRGNWRYIVAIGLTALFAFCVVAVIYQDSARSEVFYQHQAEQAAQAARDSGAIHAQRVCVSVPIAERAECQADEYNEARERERNEYDLQAQLVMATWTRAMGLAALIATIASMVGIGLVFVTFWETRRAAKYASRTYQAFVAVEEANLAPHVADVARHVQANGAALWNFTLMIANLGRAPAILHSVKLGERTQMFELVIPCGENPRLGPWSVVSHGGTSVYFGSVQFSSGVHRWSTKEFKLVIADKGQGRPAVSVIQGDTKHSDDEG